MGEVMWPTRVKILVASVLVLIGLLWAGLMQPSGQPSPPKAPAQLEQVAPLKHKCKPKPKYGKKPKKCKEHKKKDKDDKGRKDDDDDDDEDDD